MIGPMHPSLSTCEDFLMFEHLLTQQEPMGPFPTEVQNEEGFLWVPWPRLPEQAEGPGEGEDIPKDLRFKVQGHQVCFKDCFLALVATQDPKVFLMGSKLQLSERGGKRWIEAQGT